MDTIINFESLHLAELEIIRFIHEFRTPFSDTFLKQLDFFDRQEFFLLLIPFIWLGHGWKAGLRVFYILLLGGLISPVLKEFFSYPRPFHLDPSLGIIQVSGYGLPSGAAQTAVLLSGILISWRNNFWTWFIAVLFVLSVSFSRIYLGVHFPTDILAGWFVGWSLYLIYAYVFPMIERRFEIIRPFSLFLISQILPLLVFFWHQPDHVSTSSIAMGMGLGIFINHLCKINLTLPKNYKESILRAVIGVIGTFLFFGLSLVFSFGNQIATLFISFFLLGLWVSFGSNLICSKLFLKHNFLPGEI